MQKITLNSNTRGCTPLTKFLGYEGENNANKLIFVFADGFVDGTAILNIQRGEDIGYVELEKVNETYEFPIKNSILGQVGEIIFQLAITTADEKRIIYDDFVLVVKEAIEADTEMPEDYPSWKSLADTKIAEINNAIAQVDAINIVVSKIDTVTTITITKKDGTIEEVKILDGEKGEEGPAGEPGPSNQLTIGTVEKGEEAKATITGNSPNQVLNLVLPKGDTGQTGEKGETGSPGTNGSDGYTPIKGVDYFDGKDGKDGSDGKNGTEIELQTNDTYIQWRYVGSSNWNNLIEISSLKGKDGKDGSAGSDGQDGRGILSFVRTSGTGSPGTTDTYTITYTDNTTTIFNVYNGKDGETPVVDLSSVYSKTESDEKFAKLDLYGDSTINVGRRAGSSVGEFSTALGKETTPSGYAAHSEGVQTNAYGTGGHSEGAYTVAVNNFSHTEGYSTIAEADYAHTEGKGTHAKGEASHVQGKYNVVDTANKYAHIVGNGNDENNRSNGHTVDWNGTGWFAGELKVGGTGQDDANALKVLASNIVTEILTGTQAQYDALGTYNSTTLYLIQEE